MPVDRKLYSLDCRDGALPLWRCPRCDAANLRIVPKTLVSRWTADTNAIAKHDAFDSSMVEKRFTALFQCLREECKEIISVAGIGKVVEEPNDDMTDIIYVDYYRPTYFSPSPNLITIPSKCPELVAYELRRAFITSWDDYSATGNRLRTATEYLLDALRIRKTKNKRGKFVRMTLHDRITILAAKYPQIGSALLAVKWLGNAGSHTADLTQKDIFDGFDIFENVLQELYEKTNQKLQKLIASVNARKGPVPAKAKIAKH